MLDLDPGASPSENAEVILAQVTSPDGEISVHFALLFVSFPDWCRKRNKRCPAPGHFRPMGHISLPAASAAWATCLRTGRRAGARKLVLLVERRSRDLAGIWLNAEEHLRTDYRIQN
jgi:hypothetical protein